MDYSHTTLRAGVLWGMGLLFLFAAWNVHAEEKKTDMLDAILSWSLQRAGVDPRSKEAESAKAFGRAWMNPFATKEDIDKELKHLKKNVLNSSENKAIIRAYKDNKAADDTRLRRISTIIFRASQHGPDEKDKARAGYLLSRSFVDTGVFGTLETHAHCIRELELTGNDWQVQEIWKLGKTPNLYDLIIAHVGTERVPSEALEVLKKWVHDGHTLLAPLAYEPHEVVSDKNSSYFGKAFGVKVLSDRTIKKHFEWIPYVGSSGSTRLSTEEKIVTIAKSDPLNTGVQQLRLDAVLRDVNKWGYRDGFQDWFWNFYHLDPSSVDSPLFQLDRKTYVAVKKYGKGKVLCYLPIDNAYDSARFWINVREWGAGYPIPEAKVEYMLCPNCEKTYPIGNKFCPECGTKLVKATGGRSTK